MTANIFAPSLFKIDNENEPTKKEIILLLAIIGSFSNTPMEQI